VLLFTPSDLQTILQAVSFATLKHHGQVRKDQQHSPYATHPIRVAQTILEIGEVNDRALLVAAILHDTIEDTGTKADEILEKFGKDVLGLVLEVTDNKSLEKIERKRLQVVHAPHLSISAKIIKLGDKLVNCHDMLDSPPADWSLTRRQDYIQWAADVVHGMRGANHNLESTFDILLADAEQTLGFTIQPFETIHQRPWAP